jgi:hypothetical protein
MTVAGFVLTPLFSVFLWHQVRNAGARRALVDWGRARTTNRAEPFASVDKGLGSFGGV